MTVTGIRQRSGVLFVAVMLAYVILISAQVNSRAGVPLLDAVVFGAFSEIQRAAASVADGVSRVWGNYIALRGAHAENEALHRQLEDLQVRFQQERALASRTRQLESLLQLRDSLQLSTRAAQVIAGGVSPDFRTVTVDQGTLDGVRSNMAVIAGAGVVGRTVTPGVRASKVQLLIDRNAAAAGIIERSRTQGVVVGTGEDVLAMQYVAGVADVRVGDVVVTSGIDGIYPKGFAIGRVENVEHGNGIYLRVLVRPGIDFLKLEEVLVVLSPPESAGGAAP